MALVAFIALLAVKTTSVVSASNLRGRQAADFVNLEVQHYANPNSDHSYQTDPFDQHVDHRKTSSTSTEAPTDDTQSDDKPNHDDEQSDDKPNHNDEQSDDDDKPNHEDDTEPECYDLYSDMAFNTLVQTFPGNPDAQATGYAACRLCTTGELICRSATIFGGKTQLIASHIHVADNGDGVNGMGPPVINFCGSSDKNLLYAAPGYLEECAGYDSTGISDNPNMKGIQSKQDDWDLTRRIRDIATYPEKYFLNFHSISSYSYWHGLHQKPRGICRGVMKKSQSEESLEVLKVERDLEDGTM